MGGQCYDYDDEDGDGDEAKTTALHRMSNQAADFCDYEIHKLVVGYDKSLMLSKIMYLKFYRKLDSTKPLD